MGAPQSDAMFGVTKEVTVAIRRPRRAGFILLMLALSLSVSGCFYGPPPRYAAPGWSYPRYAYRPAPYYGGGYGYDGGHGYGRHPYWR